MDRYEFPLLVEFLGDTWDPPPDRFSRGIHGAMRLGVNGLTIDALIREHLWDEYLEWVEENIPSAVFTWDAIRIANQIEAVAYKMRWPTLIAPRD
jgi:hypothetical protein